MVKERFLNYTDAIVAIIATIMILELPIPKNASLSALKLAMLPFFAYLLSFLVIWVVWFNHHGLFNSVRKINARVYWYNGLWIFTMSLFPFFTAWVGRYPDKVLPEFSYLSLILLWSISFTLMETELIREKENRLNANDHNRYPRKGYYLIILTGFGVVWFYPVYVLLTILIFLILSIRRQVGPRVVVH
ncbi:DUF1211 domain-containing protein [Weissella muntiaci]|uniref:DUF1211 domain-containing protein n=1 Tax=Weissella muntiaci TaxID=2508881 RepID=A0A6C2C3H2_9LACO|nr:TMEM175 family protein [Weissella muntiaci]TYC47775.1 DUF1211 domain-containing protein [Weissella muntiaci]